VTQASVARFLFICGFYVQTTIKFCLTPCTRPPKKKAKSKIIAIVRSMNNDKTSVHLSIFLLLLLYGHGTVYMCYIPGPVYFFAQLMLVGV
jgi:hypothetical protein